MSPLTLEYLARDILREHHERAAQTALARQLRRSTTATHTAARPSLAAPTLTAKPVSPSGAAQPAHPGVTVQAISRDPGARAARPDLAGGVVTCLPDALAAPSPSR